MGDVVTMQGTEFQTPGTLANWLKKRYDGGEVRSVVILINTPEGMVELAYSRQSRQDIVFAASILNGVAMEFAMSALLPEES